MTYLSLSWPNERMHHVSMMDKRDEPYLLNAAEQGFVVNDDCASGRSPTIRSEQKSFVCMNAFI